MRPPRPHHLISIGLGVALLCTLGLLPVTLPAPETIVPATEATHTLGEIDDNSTVTQQFLAEGTGIRTISIFLGTYQRKNRGTLFVTIQSFADGRWTPLQTGALDKAALRDNSFATVAFSPPLPVSPRQPVLIGLASAGGDANNAITWWAAADWRPEGYVLQLNGRTQPGTARFQAVYNGTPGRAWQFARPLEARVSVFLNPLWQVLLLIGFVIAVGGIATLARPLPD